MSSNQNESCPAPNLVTPQATPEGRAAYRAGLGMITHGRDSSRVEREMRWITGRLTRSGQLRYVPAGEVLLVLLELIRVDLATGEYTYRDSKFCRFSEVEELVMQPAELVIAAKELCQTILTDKQVKAGIQVLESCGILKRRRERGGMHILLNCTILAEPAHFQARIANNSQAVKD